MHFEVTGLELKNVKCIFFSRRIDKLTAFQPTSSYKMNQTSKVEKIHPNPGFIHVVGFPPLERRSRTPLVAVTRQEG